ncbi:MAG: hypothetical protein L6Q97_06610 [Thermoanaerobaculia bacterium]|nr:hypothetical protein [Thermoanaerobaculia bacterium]
MKIFKSATLCVLLALCFSGLDAQNVIKQSKLSATTIGTKQVYKVSATQLKNGTNVVKMDSGDRFELVLRKGTITSMKRIDRGGITVNIPMSTAGPAIDGNGYSCNGIFCRCEGDLDCNDMFSGDDCGCCTGICVETLSGESYCICFQ